jgi:hypothetical protein
MVKWLKCLAGNLEVDGLNQARSNVNECLYVYVYMCVYVIVYVYVCVSLY